MARYLVTGGSGFCGGHLAQTLVDRGHEVRVIDVVEPEIDAENLTFQRVDVREAHAVREATRGVDRVVHAAAKVPVTKAGQVFREVNVDGTRHVVEAANAEDVDHLVHLSSSSVYALDEMPVTEDTPLSPKGPYSASKAEADRLVQAEAEVPASIVRPRTVVGPRRAGLFSILFDWIEEGRRVYTVGPGDNVFQMISARDLTELVLRAADREGETVEVFNAGTDRFGTMREAIETVVEHAGTGSRVASLPRGSTKAAMWLADQLGLSPLATFHYKTIDRDVYFDVSRTKRRLDWEPSDANEDCMRQAYDAFVADDAGGASGEAGAHRKAPAQGVLAVLKRLS
jgi:nucleoside-diphosphate-sugar epimerase